MQQLPDRKNIRARVRHTLLAAVSVISGLGMANVVLAQEGQDVLSARIEQHQPDRYAFVKDRPILGWQIVSGQSSDIPPVIWDNLGTVDQTKYTAEYLTDNIGSIVSLQMTSDGPDFYIIGKSVFDEKYVGVGTDEVAQKNSRLIERLDMVPELAALLAAGHPQLVGALKSEPVDMIRLSDIGYPQAEAVTIKAPWGEQSKPADQDAFLVWDTSQDQYYMVNQGADGNPIGYVVYVE